MPLSFVSRRWRPCVWYAGHGRHEATSDRLIASAERPVTIIPLTIGLSVAGKNRFRQTGYRFRKINGFNVPCDFFCTMIICGKLCTVMCSTFCWNGWMDWHCVKGAFVYLQTQRYFQLSPDSEDLVILLLHSHSKCCQLSLTVTNCHTENLRLFTTSAPDANCLQQLQTYQRMTDCSTAYNSSFLKVVSVACLCWHFLAFQASQRVNRAWWSVRRLATWVMVNTSVVMALSVKVLLVVIQQHWLPCSWQHWHSLFHPALCRSVQARALVFLFIHTVLLPVFCRFCSINFWLVWFQI